MNVKHTALLIAVMALSTYAMRAVPFVLFRKKIENRFVRSFFYYIPYAVLAAMTVPAIFFSTGSLPAAVAGTVAAIVLAYRDFPMIVVAAASAVVALIVSFFAP